MKNVSILEDDDTINSDDWCRPLQIVSGMGGYSDEYHFTSTYSGQPENNVLWVRVDKIFGKVWFGATVKDINKVGLKYEFIRGDIPKSHMYGKTNKDYFEEYERDLDEKIKIGKHKGKTWRDVKTFDNDYFIWAVGQNIAPTRKEDYGR